jgi:hypothetical protein
MPLPQHSHISVCHYTPLSIVNKWRSVVGGRIDLDPASDEFGNQYIHATKIYTEADDGLNKPWSGNILCNPPGLSESGGGAALWWNKLLQEFCRDGSINALFVGFSLELLQTAQRFPVPQPLDYTYCIPKRRLKFDVNTRDLIARSLEELTRTPNMSAIKYRKLHRRINDATADYDAGRQRIEGGSPTHGNILVCVSRDRDLQTEFRVAFSSIGYIGGV